MIMATLLSTYKANKEESSSCMELRKGFEEACPPTWVTHFDRED